MPGGRAGLRLAWDPNAPASLGEGGADGSGRSAWQIEGALDGEAVEGLRLISVAFEDGRALALAALRPSGGDGHDRDSVAVHLEDSGEPVPLTEALLSTEYDAEGLPRRVGAELWTEPESAPMRLAGDRLGEVEVRAGHPRREAARMSFRLEGVAGVGSYELLRPA
jgi:hypothetical protein